MVALKRDFVRAKSIWGLHLVFKSKDKTLEVVRGCRAAWQEQSTAALRVVGVEVECGTDTDRNVSYEVCAQSGIEWEGLDEALKVAWVRETPLKEMRAGQIEEFWVLTTDAALGGGEAGGEAGALGD